jgi:uncharacterized protein YjbI with pentapeptide repeats
MADKEKIIFVGHGAPALWREIEPWARRKGFRCLEFNSSSPVGDVALPRVMALLERAAFALLVLTGEDEHSDGSIHTRENVIHEVGLCHGKLGLSRTAILLEEGCSTFSNLAGLQAIKFPRGDLHSASAAVRRLLTRWSDEWEADSTGQPVTPGNANAEVPTYGPSTAALPSGLTSATMRRASIALRDPRLLYPASGVALILTQFWSILAPYLLWIGKAALVALVAIALIVSAFIAWRNVQIARQLARIRKHYSSGGRNFREYSFRGTDFAAIDLRSADFSRSDFERVNLSCTKLDNTVWRDASVVGSQLNEISAREADFSCVSFESVSLVRSNLGGSNLSGASLVECTLDDSILASTKLRDAYLRQTSLANANLEGGVLRDANLHNVDLRGANLRHADMRAAELHDTSLRDADLSYADLRSVDFHRCDLRGAKLLGIKSKGADLQDCRTDDEITT